MIAASDTLFLALAISERWEPNRRRFLRASSPPLFFCLGRLRRPYAAVRDDVYASLFKTQAPIFISH
jgi:hypothetical protein